MKKVDKKDFVGKTIKSLNTSCVNALTFEFTDDTRISPEVEAVSPGLYGILQEEEPKRYKG